MWKIFIVTPAGKRPLGPPLKPADIGPWLLTLRSQFPNEKFGIVTV